MGIVRLSRPGLAVLCVAFTVVPVGAAATISLSQRVVRSGELAGMQPSAPLRTSTNLSSWLAGEGLSGASAKPEVTRLRKLGFVAGAAEGLESPSDRHRIGLSLVEQFSSAKSAKAELAYESSTNGPWTYFTVSGIPGARGFEETSASSSGRNVAFSDGGFYYLVGVGWTGGASNGISRSTLIAVAVALYHRVHGK
jgi:hypothetical protein